MTVTAGEHHVLRAIRSETRNWLVGAEEASLTVTALFASRFGVILPVVTLKLVLDRLQA